MTSRLFTFGCSFTRYAWPTWADILALDMGVDYYNSALPGAGNQYIFNSVQQADAQQHFTPEDHVLICWTNVSRVDTRTDEEWITPGNIFNQRVYPRAWVRDFCQPFGMTVRDYAVIKSVMDLLDQRGVQQRHFSMVNLMIQIDQFEQHDLAQSRHHLRDWLDRTYEPYLARIEPSFYDQLWQGSINNKFAELGLISERFKDPHPSPAEHARYLEQQGLVLKSSTWDLVTETQNLWRDTVRQARQQHLPDQEWRPCLRSILDHVHQPAFMIF